MSRLGLVFTAALAMLFACAGVVLAQSQDPDDGQAAEGEEFVEDISGLDAGDPIPGKYIVVLEDEVSDPASVADDLSGELDLETTNVYDDALEGFAAEVPASELPELRSDPRVDAVIQDRVIETSRQTKPTGVKRIDRGQSSTRSVVQEDGVIKASRKKKSRQKRPTGIRRIKATQSSTKAGNGKGRVNADIAILDSGIYKKHRDLNIAGGINCLGKKKKAWSDGYGHGTHVAGTAAAKDNRIGVVGVAPGARLWAVKVLDNNGTGSFDTALCGINWITGKNTDGDTTNDIEVANMSFGATVPGSDDGNCGWIGDSASAELHQAVCKSVAAGTFYAAAAGNKNKDFATTIPAAFDQVLTTTAMADFNGKPGGGARPTCTRERDDTVDNLSNYITTSSPDEGHTIAAPGVCIRSTWNNGKYTKRSGTSMASPHVAGTAALCIVKGLCPRNKPEKTIKRLRDDAEARPESYGYDGDPSDPISARYYGYLVYAGGY